MKISVASHHSHLLMGWGIFPLSQSESLAGLWAPKIGVDGFDSQVWVAIPQGFADVCRRG